MAGPSAREEGEPSSSREAGNKTGFLPNALPTSIEDLKCPNCGKSYQKQANLNKHASVCKAKPISSPNKCRFCADRFNTPAGARQHERKRHPDLYHQELGQQLREPDSELYRKIAEIEANYNGKQHLNHKIAEETGLTTSQVINKRRNPVYKLYLDSAIKRKLDNAQIEEAADPTHQPEARIHEIPETWYLLAEIELRAAAGASFLRSMCEATGLTNYKIRTIRESIEYREFLKTQRISMVANEPQQHDDTYHPSQSPIPEEPSSELNDQLLHIIHARSSKTFHKASKSTGKRSKSP